MKRNSIHTAVYIFLIGLFIPLLIVSIVKGTALVLLFVVALVLVSGRMAAGYCLRNLFRARDLVDDGQIEQAIATSKAFLSDLAREPWRRHFMHFFIDVQTRNAEAMAHNNIGAASLNAGALDEAKAHFEKALDYDPNYAVAYFNLSIIASVKGDLAGAGRYAAIATRNGYKGGSFTQLLSQVSSAHARAVAKTR